MNHPKISVVIATHNRANYFRRSLACYAQQTFKDFEIILLDDSSTDAMTQLCRGEPVLDVKHFWFKRPENKFRDCGSILNYGIRAAAGDFIMVTSPEVMPGKTLLEQMLKVCAACPNPLAFYTAKCYLLTQAMQQQIDTVDWLGMGIAAAIRLLPDFYNQPTADPSKFDTYLARNIESASEFITNMMCGMTRAGWRNMGGFPESDVWGPGDLSWLNERHRLLEGVMSCVSCHNPHEPSEQRTPGRLQAANVPRMP